MQQREFNPQSSLCDRQNRALVKQIPFPRLGEKIASEFWRMQKVLGLFIYAVPTQINRAISWALNLEKIQSEKQQQKQNLPNFCIFCLGPPWTEQVLSYPYKQWGSHICTSTVCPEAACSISLPIFFLLRKSLCCVVDLCSVPVSTACGCGFGWDGVNFFQSSLPGAVV